MGGLELLLPIVLLAFLCEFIDSSLGMGYGTTLTPLLMLMGYNPLQIVPAVLLSELFTGFGAAFFHHQFKNVNFRVGNRDLKIALIMGGCSVVGALAAVLIAMRLPASAVKLYIGILVFAMGVIILATLNRNYPFSWRKIVGLGLLAAFNKGISGGGYGPVVTGGQILSGVKEKSAIGIASLAEGLTCVVGVAMYVAFTNHTVDWRLAPSLVLGAVVSVPFAAFAVKKFKTGKLRLLVGIATVALGLLTLLKLAQA
jgi:uncharacterized membrane protein YfcA